MVCNLDAVTMERGKIFQPRIARIYTDEDHCDGDGLVYLRNNSGLGRLGFILVLRKVL